MTPQSTNRINEIKEIYNLNDTNIPKYKVKYTSSVNSLQIKQALQELKPDLVIVNGTPIIKESILTATQAHFLNIHVGITPKYRGVHGGYWAYYNNDGDLAGVTIHLIDTGIDTGEVLEQKLILKDKKDNFITYPVLQIGEALKNYNNIIRSLLNNEFKIKSPMTNESNLWYHPTLLEYLFGRIKRNIK